jgi:hypothetical protein
MLGQPGVMDEVVLRPDSELQPTREPEERYRAMFELAPDDAVSRQGNPSR